MLNVVAKDLQEKYRGTLASRRSKSCVRQLHRLAATATVDQWLVLGTEKSPMSVCKPWSSRGPLTKRLPGVLFLCVTTLGAHRWHWAGSDSLRAIERLLGREAPPGIRRQR